MTIKSAEPHTIAPRLGYLEDKVDYLAQRTGGDGGTDPSPRFWILSETVRHGKRPEFENVLAPASADGAYQVAHGLVRFRLAPVERPQALRE